MKRACLILCCILLLAGCGTQKPEASTVPRVTEMPATTAATEHPTTAPQETRAEHSEWYLPGVAVEDVIIWFNEVCLDSEFSNGGNSSLVQKWQVPIRCALHGEPTPEDLQVLEDFSRWLNELEGFPGFSLVETWENPNMNIHFTDEAGLTEIMGPDYLGLDGAVTFWYDDDIIHDGVICVRTDLSQHLRNSVLLEEIYNGLGPVQDTVLREDSIIYQNFAEPQALTQVDELLLRLLYHPDIRCGMNVAECEAVIRQLYY